MSDMNIDFCSLLLADARLQAKQHKVTVPKGMSCYRHDIGNNPQYEVWANGKGLVWQGSASCAYEAKANYINSLLPELV